jgi:probable rRNA maturation factor
MPCEIDDRQQVVRLPAARLRRAAERALAAAGRPASDVEIQVVDDAEIRQLNARHRGVSRRTDVLAFPLEVQPGAGLLGQVVISAETARRQARRLGVPLALELELLVTHAVLHLVGYDDRDPVEAQLMHQREREILTAFGHPIPARLFTGLLHP